MRKMRFREDIFLLKKPIKRHTTTPTTKCEQTVYVTKWNEYMTINLKTKYQPLFFYCYFDQLSISGLCLELLNQF